MSDWISSRERYGEAFWRAHHEAWKRSDLNQRQYCEVYGLLQEAFEVIGIASGITALSERCIAGLL